MALTLYRNKIYLTASMILIKLFQAVPGQIQSHLNGKVEESVLFKPFSKIESKSNFSQNEVDTLKADVKKVIESAIRPAFKKLLR